MNRGDEGDIEKAKELMDLAMEKMPIEIFEFYTLVEPYVSGYYEIGEKDKAREIWTKLAAKYQEKLTHYSTFSELDQIENFETIVTDIERYRSLVDLLVFNRDEEWLPEKAREFNNYLRLFRAFLGDDEYDDDEPALPLETSPEDGIPIPADADSVDEPES